MPKLSDKLSLVVEPYGKKLRLIITEGQTELACRKETAGNLKRFISSTEKNLFKGRLQLHKNNDTIIIMLKGEIAGAVAISLFENYLP
jgi:hypothetical protein